VIKVPEARTIEGSVGGTVNLRTIRPLELAEPLVSGRAQLEYSDFADNWLPRFSGTIGNRWDTGAGEFGVVISGSYARQDVTAFRPRVDRDAVVLPTDNFASAESFPFLRIQFFDQDLDNFEYETMNLVGSVEWKPSPDLRLFADVIYNDQDRRGTGTRAQLSGVAASDVVDNTTNTSFETVDFGRLDGPDGPIDLGTVEAALTGVLEPGSEDPNLRTSADASARMTKSHVYRLGGEWERNRLAVRLEGALSTSDTVNPTLTSILDFINPNHIQPQFGVNVDNGVPVEFDLRDETLQFGIAQGLPTTPTSAMLLDPANYQLRQVQQRQDINENRALAGRLDLSYDTRGLVPLISAVNLGYRFSEDSSLNDDFNANFNYTSATSAFARPSADRFSGIVIPGPSNFGAADGRDLFIGDYLVVDPQLTLTDPDAIREALNAAIAASNADNPDLPPVNSITTPTQAANAFFDITERTHAAYFQLDFDGFDIGVPIRGNLGVRYVNTRLNSLGNTIVNGVAEPVTQSSSYDFFLPRFNLVIEPAQDFLIRAGVAKDINRPNFDSLSTSVSFGTGPNTPVPVGNPDLVPESVWSFDLSGDWYFAPSSVLSVGVFHKIRTNLFSAFQDDPAPNQDADGNLNIDITPPCEDGGIFNPIADRNINNPTPGSGICVPRVTTVNGEGTTTQSGIEVAFQHDLSRYEDALGFASGFGFTGNYTYQVTGGSAQDFPSNFRDADGPRNVFTNLGFAGAQDRITLENLSRHSYNATLFYDKYGLNARVRYTWRSSYISTDSFFFGLPRVNGARGQLNASVNYDVTDNINVGIEGINLLQQDQQQFCVNDGALLCFQGLTDRRIVIGATITL
jgi:TonB-dependent receptor